MILKPLKDWGCYQSQNYKIWKQFTTHSLPNCIPNWLLSITKLQNLKAIHNTLYTKYQIVYVVINHKTTKFESNSQHDTLYLNRKMCCYQSQNYKIWKQFTTKQESKWKQYCCYQSQNYKIWKQFTTLVCILFVNIMLLLITKLQNLKAIHNDILRKSPNLEVVINHKTTKFESNSQHKAAQRLILYCCYQSQNYKIWKQFTTPLRR